jgi:hypothetical protein
MIRKSDGSEPLGDFSWTVDTEPSDLGGFLVLNNVAPFDEILPVPVYNHFFFCLIALWLRFCCVREMTSI